MAVDDADSQALTPEEIDVLVRRLAEHQISTQSDEGIDLLRQRYEEFTHPELLSKGSLVVWKQGLKNKRRPAYGQPAIVAEVFSEPLLSPQERPGSVYFREPLSAVVAFLDEDDELILLHVDSRRFRLLR